MAIKPKYSEIPGSKFITIQLEFPAQCQKRDILMLLEQFNCEKPLKPQNMEQAAVCADFIQRLELNLVNILIKKDSVTEMHFGVYQNIFIVSVSFIYNVTYCNLVIDAFLNTIHNYSSILPYQKSAVLLLKPYTDIQINENELRKIIFVMTGKAIFTIFSKLEQKQFWKQIGDKNFNIKQTTKINKINESQQHYQSNQKDYKDYQIKSYEYMMSSQYKILGIHKNKMGIVIESILLAGLNDNFVDYIVDTDYIYIRKNSVYKFYSTINWCRQLLKQRLKYYSSKKVTEKNLKKLPKNNQQLLQMIAQQAVIPQQQLMQFQQELPDAQFDDTMSKMIMDAAIGQ